jgi:transposase
MKKRSYKATIINHVKHSAVASAVQGQRVVFGIDIAKDVCFGRLVTEEREVVVTVKWHQLTETRQLLGFLTSLPAKRIEAAMEPSGTYGDALRYQLKRAGLEVYRVSGKRCHDAAEVYDGVPSMHDAKAADIVARLHLDGASAAWRVASEDERALSSAVQLMAMYDDQYARALNRIEAQLARSWPELTSVLKLGSATLLSLLSTFGSASAVAQAPQQATELMRRVGGHLLRAEKIEQVLHTAVGTMGVAVVEAERQLLMKLAAEADRNRKEADAAHNQVKARCQGNEEVRRIAEVVGVLAASVLMCKVGRVREFGSSKSYVKAMGLNLKERSSGKHKGQLKITKRGPSEARRYLYLASLRLIQNSGDAVVRAWYLRKVKRDGGHVKQKAVTAVMRKLALALFHVGGGATFDASKLFDKRRLSRQLAESAAA